ncbi:MAG: hypothetical protein JXR49_04860 [Acidobacteria bacterium]|nr:hypothetical protein [Acidobacteriota bacterium]
MTVFLDQDHQRAHFGISTFNRGEFIKLVMDGLVETEPLPICAQSRF